MLHTARAAFTTLAVVAVLGASVSALTTSNPASAQPNSACAQAGGALAGLLPSGSAVSAYLCAQAGDLIDVRIGDVHGTQPSLGRDEVFYKLGRYTLGKDAINKKFDDWCEANGQVKAATVAANATLADRGSFTCDLPIGQETAASIAPMKTVVIGPGGTLYLADGHHTLTSFYELPDGGPNLHLRLNVLGNLSQYSGNAFWAEMARNGWVWNRDVDGNVVPYEQLPASVGLSNYADDKYRSLMYFARDIGYTENRTPFQEFYWGSWLRDTGAADLSAWNANDLTSYLDTLARATMAQSALPGDAVVDSGLTAAQLGALAQWNDGKSTDKGEFANISKPYSDPKPGKIAYSLEYKAIHGK
ncbi:ParB/Srx family N-terminal domain-containing protein [Nocardia sp. NPDC004604]|uniref:ParB/Srx family N-terminal domain-containing protein n=1 Tax=Nocardia sp. NPDC004604 TaxID=3157013 RepID=UPI0033A443BA